ncbi:MAG TPA: DUF433 domain-containing protein [Planctomycetota bacterium]|jgi:uncharacterized protein (DUF433 family)
MSAPTTTTTAETLVETIPLKKDAYGVYRVGGTRVTLESVIHVYDQGAAPEDIVSAFPTLSIEDVHLVIGYYLRHPKEMAAYMKEYEEAAKKMRELCEQKFGLSGLRERLLARKRQMEAAK